MARAEALVQLLVQLVPGFFAIELAFRGDQLPGSLAQS
jgi:hypothetical protein